MKEFSFRWSEGFTKGIRPHFSVGLNALYLYDANNVKIGSFGVEPVPGIYTITDMPAIDWPMPQIIATSYGPMIAAPTELFSLNPLSLLLTSVIAGIPSSQERYDVADFDLYQVWTNGVTVIVRDYLGAWAIYVAALTPYSVCNFRGQLVAGGFGTGVYKNWVAWGGIGEVDLAVLLSTSLGLAVADYSANKNTAGNRVMPFTGQIYNVKPLGNKVIVYGADGIVALVAVEEPAPTFGLRNLGSIGLINRGAVGGNEDIHVFVDKLGYVWSIDKELKMNRLGYSEMFFNSISDVVVSHDPMLKDFYIANEETCGLLADGMSRIYCVPTSVVRVNNSLIGPFAVSAESNPYVIACEFDCSLRGIKTLTGIEFGASGSGLKATVDYRYSVSEAFRAGVEKTLTKNGTVAPLISAVEFRVKLEGSNASDFRVNYMSPRYKLSDKRLIRGTYAQANRVVPGSGK